MLPFCLHIEQIPCQSCFNDKRDRHKTLLLGLEGWKGGRMEGGLEGWKNGRVEKIGSPNWHAPCHCGIEGMSK